jgi:hypothetical protein
MMTSLLLRMHNGLIIRDLSLEHFLHVKVTTKLVLDSSDLCMCCVENIRCHKLFDSVSRHVQSAAPSQMVESVLGMLARVSEMLVEQLQFQALIFRNARY